MSDNFGVCNRLVCKCVVGNLVAHLSGMASISPCLSSAPRCHCVGRLLGVINELRDRMIDCGAARRLRWQRVVALLTRDLRLTARVGLMRCLDGLNILLLSHLYKNKVLYVNNIKRACY